MKRKELDALKTRILEKRQKAADLDVLVEALLALSAGQVKKLLTGDVLAVLEKYGDMEAE